MTKLSIQAFKKTSAAHYRVTIGLTRVRMEIKHLSPCLITE